MVTMNLPDIDIDCANREHVLSVIKHIPARLAKDGRKHASGVYVTNVPLDPINSIASIDYNEAESRGYFKLDFLNMSVYQLIKDQEHYEQMIDKQPEWSNLWTDQELVSKLAHVNNYFDLLVAMKPDTLEKLAAFVSIIRPGKAHLQRKPWPEVIEIVWDGNDNDGYVFRKSHAFSYAMLVMLHLNLLTESLDLFHQDH